MIQVKHIPINDLRPAEYNPRKISKADLDKLKKNITEFGMVDPIIVNHDMTVIGGHQRLKVCKTLKMETMPCIVVNLSKEKEKALNLSLNRISGEWDEETLKQVIGDLASLEEFDMDLTGFDGDEVNALLGTVNTIDLPDLPEGDRQPFQQMTFTLHDSQKDIVDLAIEKAKEQKFYATVNENSNGNALFVIAEAYLK